MPNVWKWMNELKKYILTLVLKRNRQQQIDSISPLVQSCFLLCALKVLLARNWSHCISKYLFTTCLPHLDPKLHDDIQFIQINELPDWHQARATFWRIKVHKTYTVHDHLRSCESSHGKWCFKLRPVSFVKWMWILVLT